MDRRNSLKSLLVGGISGGLILSGCKPEVSDDSTLTEAIPSTEYGRTEKEKAHDAKLNSEQFFNEHEISTIAVLCDHILPATATAGSATEAGVPEFIEFIVKDISYHQTPIRGGIMWLDHRSTKLFNSKFMSASVEQQKQLLDEIAFSQEAKPEVEQGVKFFSHMRNLVLTGYYTSKIGISDLGYQGNSPNVWDGVPAEVLEKHGLSYDPEWLAKCVDQNQRMIVAKWDENGNLIN